MKIAILNIYSGKIDRGAEIWTKSISEELGKKNEITVFQIGTKKGKNFKTREIRKVPYIRSGFLYHLNVLWFSVLCLFCLLSEKYDWIIPVNGRFQVILIRFLRFVKGGKILIVGHAGIGREDKINLLFGMPNVFIALTKTAEKWAKSIANRKTDVVFIPNGVDLEIFNKSGEKAQLKLAEPVILCISELLPYKRVEYLVHAVFKVKEANLLIIGRGEDENKIDNLGIRLLGKRYFRINYVDHSEIGKYYRSCKIFSLPSRESEAFGLVYLEAMATNLPIVAPDDPNRRMLIGNAGVYADMEDISNYANAIRLALGKDFKNTPRIRSEKYSWTNISKMYEQILEKKSL